jgi:hypothetical protein
MALVAHMRAALVPLPNVWIGFNGQLGTAFTARRIRTLWPIIVALIVLHLVLVGLPLRRSAREYECARDEHDAKDD